MIKYNKEIDNKDDSVITSKDKKNNFCNKISNFLGYCKNNKFRCFTFTIVVTIFGLIFLYGSKLCFFVCMFIIVSFFFLKKKWEDLIYKININFDFDFARLIELVIVFIKKVNSTIVNGFNFIILSILYVYIEFKLFLERTYFLNFLVTLVYFVFAFVILVLIFFLPWVINGDFNGLNLISLSISEWWQNYFEFIKEIVDKIFLNNNGLFFILLIISSLGLRYFSGSLLLFGFNLFYLFFIYLLYYLLVELKILRTEYILIIASFIIYFVFLAIYIKVINKIEKKLSAYFIGKYFIVKYLAIKGYSYKAILAVYKNTYVHILNLINKKG